MTQTVPATAVLGPGATGLTIGLRVLNLDGTTYAAFSTTGIAETSVLGTYRKASGVVCPDAGAYIVWGVSGTDYAEATVEPVSAISDIQARLPAALIGGRIDANTGAISGDTTAADNLETMLDGTGGQVLSLKQLDIVNNDSAPGGQGIDITARQGLRVNATDRGLSIVGGSNQALYLASSTAAATIYVEGPSVGGGSAIAISSPGSTPAGTPDSGEAVWIETSDGHPALRVDFGAAGGNVFDVQDSDNGDWVWDDKLFAAATDAATAVRSELATELAHLDADVSEAGGLTAQETRDAMKLAPTAGSPAAGSVDAHLDAIQAQTDTIDDIKAVTDALDVTAVTQVAASSAGHLTITVGLTFDEGVTGLTIPADWVTALWTLKNNARDADTASLVQLRATNPAAGGDGLQRLNGAALVAPITAADGELAVTQATGRIDMWLSDEMTVMLGAATAIGWDVKFIDSSGDSSGRRGTADVVLTETKSTA